MSGEVLVVFGTRPEAIKLGPLVAELRALRAPVKVIATGQHSDLLRGTPAETDLMPCDSLALASDGNVVKWMTSAQRALKARIEAMQPSIVVVQGDTMSADAASVAANACDVPLAHVEAGLRSGNEHDPWPEERTRKAIAGRATWHYAPTSTAFANLLAEGVDQRFVRVTGNTCVSAIARYAPQVRPIATPQPIVLVTLHRREVQRNDVADRLYGAIRQAALVNTRLHFVWPLHPGMKRYVNRFREPWNLKIVEPMRYVDCLQMLSEATGAITDSGGLVEEAATLGVPTAILRMTNDRPEAELAGIARRFAPDWEGVQKSVDFIEHAERRPSNCFGEPSAAREIAMHLATLAKGA